MAIIHLYSSPILAVSKNNGFESVTTSPMDDVLPRETVECADLDAVIAALDEYAGRCAATGKPGDAGVRFGKQKARKFRGFDSADLSRRYNLDKLEG